jgi:type II secretory pathway pseudopilin PulG
VNISRHLRRLRRSARADEGIGLVEVLVALMIFSIIAIGMAYSMLSISRLTRESISRETATNLAAQEIDWAQSQSDAFKVFSRTTVATVDGVDYTIRTSVGWVSTTGSTGSCGTGGGNLQYKRVNVEVTWPGQYLQSPVRADSALAPESRINDPSFGTILIAVTGEDGTGRSGVTVTATPVVDGATITETIDATDADGCSYVLKVVPGTYKVTVSKSNYVSKVDQQASTPFKSDLQVVAGATATAAFTYDQASSFTLKYAANSTKSVTTPDNLDVAFVGGLADVIKSSPGSPTKLYPMPAGYQAIAGDYTACNNMDPSTWTATTGYLAGIRANEVGTAPGGSATLPIPMGVVEVKVPNDSSRRYITAVQQGSSGSGNPGCATTKNYTFPRFSANSTQNLALPFGTWKIYAGKDPGSTTQLLTSTSVKVLGSVVSLDSGGSLRTDQLGNSGVNASTSVVTLDPREPES